MRALQYQKPDKLVPVRIKQPLAGPGEVLIRVKYAGICGTDLHILKNEAPTADRIVLGHEFSGIVAATGPNVAGLQPDQPVAVDPNNFCGECVYCRRGQVHFCENLQPIGIARNGAWAEYCAVPARQVYPLPKKVPLEWGALAEPLSCILHGWDRLQAIGTEQRVLIIGAGIIGLLWGLLLKSHGFSDVMLSEPQDKRRHIANGLGLRSRHPDTITGENEMFDIIIDCSGNPGAIETAIQWLAPQGKFLFFGIVPHGITIRLEPFQLFRKELTLLGSVINPFTFSRALELISRIRVPLPALGIGLFSPDDYQAALTAVANGQITKGIFRYDG